MTYEEAIKRIKQFGLYHAIDDLPNSILTVQAFDMAIEALERRIPKKPQAFSGGWPYECECGEFVEFPTNTAASADRP